MKKNDGPTLKHFFTCDRCKYLTKVTSSSMMANNYRCFHDNVLSQEVSGYSFIIGNIPSSKITPSFCPFLMKKLRKEKLKKINERKI